ncbi:MAG: YaeQ family protein [Bacteroidota bacterium]
MQIRLALSAVDRGLDLNLKLILARRPDEPTGHVVLRVLAYCLFYREDLGGGLRFAPGPADRDSPDLWVHDLVGQPIEWIVCGDPDVDELRHVLKHQRQAKVRVLFGSERVREAFFQRVRSSRHRVPGIETVDFCEVSAELVGRLMECELERQRWAVTLVEDHLYVDVGGIAADSEVTRPSFVEERGG